jgi:hypothetical protein
VTGSTLIRVLCIGGLGLAGTTAVGQEIYCWKDEQEITRCSDAVPPDQARFDRNVRNEQGIIVRFEEGEITPEEQQEIVERMRREEAARRQEEERLRYDRLLLDSYESIEDIEERRDRLMDQIQGNIIVAELYLGNLGSKLESLRQSAERYAPHSDRENAPPIPENLVEDIRRTESSIAKFEQRLAQIHAERESTREQFEGDITRFRELKGI